MSSRKSKAKNSLASPQSKTEADNKLVRYSRAGDAFHYRWAARRSLRMIDPKFRLHCITVESSKYSRAVGEYSIDLAEYSVTETGQNITAYYQLKHSTVRTHVSFGFNDLKRTISDFAQRFKAEFINPKKTNPKRQVSFSIVTNRPVSKRIKQTIQALATGAKANQSIQRSIEQATKLRNTHLRDFCSALTVIDEGDYVVQKQRLHGEISEYLAGFIHSQEVDTLIEMVAERALPSSNGEIYPEDVLKRLGVSPGRGLFPAPPEFDQLPHVVRREQHADLLNHITTFAGTTIVHAAGGIGKSVVARQIAETLPAESRGIVYDCFGGGKYRNPSQPRHRPGDALVQIANELAAIGLCRPLLDHPNTPSDALFHGFRNRLEQAIVCLRQVRSNALLVILVDAADNAEMAAAENSETCFVRPLLREPLPDGCRLVALCRTERIYLLQPNSRVSRFELKPFSRTETARHLRNFYLSSSDHDCLELHRLSGGNPRVQANAIGNASQPLEQMLAKLGPLVTTVDEQISDQLESAVNAIRDKLPANFDDQIESICRGLANLPPFVPLKVLAKAAGVDVSLIHSFVSDLGRPLWHSDDSVQFRDEPTETWFRNKFATDANQISLYAKALEPLATEYTYVATSLPQLLLRAGDHDRLIELALSDELLPVANPIDERNVRVYRLQFAFKAALQLKRLSAAAQLAFRAGEEVAGDQRQVELFKKNVDLIEPLQNAQRVQEIGYRQLLRAAWQGSENVYSASLLSTVKDFHGEAQSYLRAARRWLSIYFETRDNLKKESPEHFHFEEQLNDTHLAELATAYQNLWGAKATVDFLKIWRPPEVVFRVGRLLIRRLIDSSRFSEVNQIAILGAKIPFLTLAVVDELADVAKFPTKNSLHTTLNLLSGGKEHIQRPIEDSYHDIFTPAILSLAEASAHWRLSKKKIMALLDRYVPKSANRTVASDYFESPRRTFMRAIALRAILSGDFSVKPASVLPEKKKDEAHRQLDDNERREISEVVEALSPWYCLRARLIALEPTSTTVTLAQVRAKSDSIVEHRYKRFDRIPHEIAKVYFEVMAYNPSVAPPELEEFVRFCLNSSGKFMLADKLAALRAACRLEQLVALRASLEESSSIAVEEPGDEGPDERSQWFIQLARAVLPISRADAAAYFAQAIEAVSKFGDEMIARWNALVRVAKRAGENGKRTPETCYRFIRCAEVVGDAVAREKYWDRDEVFRVAVHLDAPGTFAALSRWRDRNVGWFDRQLFALGMEAVENRIISPSVGWSLSGFSRGNRLAEYASICIGNEKVKEAQQRIFDSVLRDLELSDNVLDKQPILREVTKSLNLRTDRLEQLVLDQSAVQTSKNVEDDTVLSPLTQIPNGAKWEKLFQDVDLLQIQGLEKAIHSLRTMEPPREFDIFWDEIVRRIPAGREKEFFETVTNIDSVDHLDMCAGLYSISIHWKKKASIKRAWPSFLKSVGNRFAAALVNPRTLDYWLKKCPLDSESVSCLKSGILEGLASRSELVDAATYFSFAEFVAEYLTGDEAIFLLTFALSRFEKHIPLDQGDGVWAPWLNVSDDIPKAVAGLIWAALGSPYSSERWEAAHCVRRLAFNGCDAEIAELIEWMDKDDVGAFGCNRFPFYRLHARQYLLIALARVALDQPKLLLPYASKFVSIALDGVAHILIQKYSAEIALAIERTHSYCSPEIRGRLEAIGKSVLGIREVADNERSFITPWHERGEVNTKLKVHLGFDFDRYWCGPLGRVFGVSQEQIVELAIEVAVVTMNLPDEDNYQPDPRQSQWNSLDQSRPGTSWSDHGNYPRVDRYAFYYSYHSVLSVASKLLSNMPVIHHVHYDDEDRWTAWLEGHSLTRSDGKWLSDRRDPAPVKRRGWVSQKESDVWLRTIQKNDFFDGLQQCSMQNSICVGGHWSDHHNDFVETISVASALVNPESSQALACALRACEPSEFRLPDYRDDEHEIDKPPFELTGWLVNRGARNDGLDVFDPHACDIPYPPIEVGESVAAMFPLSVDTEHREWRFAGTQEAVLLAESWSQKDVEDAERPFRSGNTISASVHFLKALCGKSGKDLILEVRIRRDRHKGRFYRRDDEEIYVPDSHKIFIFSANGLLKDSTTSRQLG